VSVTIGGVPAQVLFAGLTPGFAGLYQVNALVPAGVTPGSQVSIVITAAGQQSKTVTIAVR
jgi:adhesin/invasin